MPEDISQAKVRKKRLSSEEWLEEFIEKAIEFFVEESLISSIRETAR